MKGEHTLKLNESIGILEKLVLSENPNLQKAVIAIAKIQIKMCKAIIWSMWNTGEKKQNSISDLFGGFGR